MLALPDIRLAAPREARHIAELSRDNIEHGLGWSRTAGRVLHAIHELSTNVAVVLKRDQVLFQQQPPLVCVSAKPHQ